MDKTEIAAGGRFYVKEPGSALTHFIGLLLAIAFMAPLLVHGAMDGSLTVNLKKAAESFEIALFFCQEICFII